MWVMPTTPGQGEQALLTKGDAYGLYLDKKGAVTLRLGGSKGQSVSTGKPLRKEWYFVAATYDAKTLGAAVVSALNGKTPSQLRATASPAAR